MQLTTALTTFILSASATPLLPRDSPPPPPPPTWTPPAMNLTTISITALSPGNPIDNTYLSAHHTGLWLNYTAAADPSTTCALVNDRGVGATVPARPWAVFLHNNDTTTLSLYNGPNEPGSSGSWQTVFDDRSAGLLRYRGLPNEAPPTDAWPDAVSGWTQSTPTVGGSVELLWQGARLWACDLGGAWRVSTQEWKVFPMGTRGCVRFIARIVREGGEEPAVGCVYSPDF
ncbi:Cell wall protein [Lasiodiplodia theobromae]|uniref:Cell wall protein n=1 Tax=Lasiodiplodia theobromae TaxID=45133 RepID=UPI0015C38AC2|nr:Cell wall protein [Lasiodiplodia theobromae]KAF4545459.1 Cell wall protein [Lasiodiplodia theobromae]